MGVVSFRVIREPCAPWASPSSLLRARGHNPQELQLQRLVGTKVVVLSMLSGGAGAARHFWH